MDTTTKDRVFSIFRYLMTALGAYMLGHNIFGLPVDESLWQEVVGTLLAVGAMVWGFVDKTITLEGFQGAIRQLVAFGGGLAVAKGLISAETLMTITGVVVTLSQWIYSWLSKKKTMRLADPNDPLELHELNGAEKTPLELVEKRVA